jgi:putative Ca2+/H+ antiporter (TMEM165/GDT1 family)
MFEALAVSAALVTLAEIGDKTHCELLGGLALVA